MDLLRLFLRAEALEALLSPEVADPGGSQAYQGPEGSLAQPNRRLSPALPAAAALRSSDDGAGDLFSQRVGSPCAVLALGGAPKELLRQRLGRQTAPAGGRDAGGFPTALNRGWIGPVSTPGLLVEVMAGVAMALRLRREPRVALLVDDTPGSASGDWHEGLNLAVVRQAPLVLVHHDVRRSALDAGADSMADRAGAYGFRSWEADESDPRAVLDVCGQAVEAARSGEGVQVVDVRSGAGDPLETLIAQLGDQGVSDDAVAALRSEATAEMNTALERVVAEPAPDLEALRVVPEPTVVDSPHPVRGPRPWS